MDELEALTRTPREYREASIMCFTETWLHGLMPDSNVTIAGFTTAAGKKKGGGLTVFVSNRWCSPEHSHVKERVCSPDVELIAIGLRPYYLPREFTNVIAITVYIPPTGDFNHASLKSTLPTFHQAPNTSANFFPIPPADTLHGFQHVTHPPDRTILHIWPGEERAGEAQPEKHCRTGRHQKSCSRQLCGILQHLFNQSLHLQRIPVLWKTSCLVPVPKKTHPVAPSDYRPIALTSHIMKVIERLVLTHLRPLVSPFQDPLQFAYQPKVGVDDAVIYLLQRAYSSLDRLNTTVRVMFFDFSSAFNTIQPRLLRAKLENMQMDAPLFLGSRTT
ncbi:hypothetical protein D4764_19G0006090 [Takifugu flavidus]|uniref:Reverse transcriptase domain-containing protein n=1 Tax=Takifugu flavidus TaxID=433684 RepID=A0A5C6NQF3_9TELE|nr:hypothetical protein D4764_19G0006090 [Takifugu flavidus]